MASSTDDSPDLLPGTGGGIVPHNPSSPESRARLVAARAAAILSRLPRPILDRLLVRMQQSTRPTDEVALGMSISEDAPGGVPTTWLRPEQRSTGVLVFVHGGSYAAGPNNAQWAWLVEIQRRTGFAAAMVRYRMPPNHPFPAAFDDTVAAIGAMQASGELAEGRWILGGDSAGGGLALATAHCLRDAGAPLPAGLLLTAPWVDVQMDHPDLLAQTRKDLALGRAVLRSAAERYAAGTPLDDARLSPIHGSMDGLPPAHIDVGTVDLFLPDVRRLRAALDTAGVEVTFIEQEGAGHTYPHRIATAEAEWTIRSQVAWMQQRVGSCTE